MTRVERTRFRLDRVHTLAAGDGICFLTPRGLVGTNVNAADGDCVTPNRMEGSLRDARSTAITTTASTCCSNGVVRGA